MTIRYQYVINAANCGGRTLPGLYEDRNGVRFRGLPVSDVVFALRGAGWRNVPRLDAYDLRKLGACVKEARYIGGARAKRFCEVLELSGPLVS